MKLHRYLLHSYRLRSGYKVYFKKRHRPRAAFVRKVSARSFIKDKSKTNNTFPSFKQSIFHKVIHLRKSFCDVIIKLIDCTKYNITAIQNRHHLCLITHIINTEHIQYKIHSTNITVQNSILNNAS